MSNQGPPSPAHALKPRLLPVIMLMLVIIGFFRANDLWVGISGAVAQSEEGADPSGPAKTPLAQSVNTLEEDDFESTAVPAADIDIALPSESQAEQRLLTGLAERRASLDLREAELDTREKLLQTAEKQIEKRLERLTEEADRLEQVRLSVDETKRQEFITLAKAYERMKPRDAARIFNLLKDDILVPVAASMRTQAISGVLAEMEPDKASALTRKLAENKGALALKADTGSDY